jgi:copper chaperone CopZ
MQTTYTIPNISCNHCTHIITMELSEIEGVQIVDAELQTQKVTVTYQEPATDQVLRETLIEINYPPAD